jgi:hypothetical protein
MENNKLKIGDGERIGEPLKCKYPVVLAAPQSKEGWREDGMRKMRYD